MCESRQEASKCYIKKKSRVTLFVLLVWHTKILVGVAQHRRKKQVFKMMLWSVSLKQVAIHYATKDSCQQIFVRPKPKKLKLLYRFLFTACVSCLRNLQSKANLCKTKGNALKASRGKRCRIPLLRICHFLHITSFNAPARLQRACCFEIKLCSCR